MLTKKEELQAVPLLSPPPLVRYQLHYCQIHLKLNSLVRTRVNQNLGIQLLLAAINNLLHFTLGAATHVVGPTFALHTRHAAYNSSVRTPMTSAPCTVMLYSLKLSSATSPMSSISTMFAPSFGRDIYLTSW